MAADSGLAARFLLVRHGETDYNKEGRWQGAGSNPPLNDTGREQARAIAAEVTGAGEAPGRSIDALYTSPQKRARQTAAIIGRRLNLVPRVAEALREIDHGLWEGKTEAEVLARWADEVRAYEADPLYVRRPGGESYADLGERLWPALEGLADRHRGETVALVAHGGPIRLILSRVLDRPLTERHAFGVENGSVFAVEETGGEWRLSE